MNPIFTLNYPELLVAEYLQKHFVKKAGYSVLVPLSGQQKGYDLALMRRNSHGTKVVTFQVKSSRTYTGSPERNTGSVLTIQQIQLSQVGSSLSLRCSKAFTARLTVM